MPLKFAANISMMFREAGSLSARYGAAAAFGFKAVEVQFPYEATTTELKTARELSGMQQVLINAYPGDFAAGERGFAALPGKELEFRESLQKAIEYAKALECNKVHVMSGLPWEGENEQRVWNTFVSNLKYAANTLQTEGIEALIEPINSRLSMPGYFMDHPHKAIQCIKQLNHPNLKLQLDIFHLQMMDGNLTLNIKNYMPYVGHIQVAQAPGRGEPDSPGEINYAYIFKVLEDSGYDGWVGLEYNPVGDTTKGLKYLQEMGYRL